MDINIAVRQKQLENLQQFIENSRKGLHGIFDELGWTEEKVKMDQQYVTCSKDENHQVPADKIHKHFETCNLKKLGYDPNEEFLSEPLNNTKSSVIIDEEKKRAILTKARNSIKEFRIGWNGADPDPKTSDRYLATFSPDERVVLYNYAKSVTVGPEKPPEFNVTNPPESDNKELSYAEQLKRERDAKRRRIKYKTVATSKKNYKDVIKEVIDNQMSLYTDWVKEKQETKGERSPSRHSSRSRKNDRHRDHHRERSRDARRRSRSRSRERQRERSRSSRRDSAKYRRDDRRYNKKYS